MNLQTQYQVIIVKLVVLVLSISNGCVKFSMTKLTVQTAHETTILGFLKGLKRKTIRSCDLREEPTGSYPAFRN